MLKGGVLRLTPLYLFASFERVVDLEAASLLPAEMADMVVDIFGGLDVGLTVLITKNIECCCGSL